MKLQWGVQRELFGRPFRVCPRCKCMFSRLFARHKGYDEMVCTECATHFKTEAVNGR